MLVREFYVTADSFRCAFSIKHDIEQMISKSILLQIFADSKYLFGIIDECCSTKDKRVLIDIRSVKKLCDIEKCLTLDLYDLNSVLPIYLLR